MKKNKKEIELPKNEMLFDVVILILGVLIFLVGGLIFYLKISGTRWGEVVEGVSAQIGGAIFILFGAYLIISTIKKLVPRNK